MGRLRTPVRAPREAWINAANPDASLLTVDKHFSRLATFNKLHLIWLCIAALLIYLAWSWTGSGTPQRHQIAALSKAEGHSSRKPVLTNFPQRRIIVPDKVAVAAGRQETVHVNGMDLRALAGQGVAAILGARFHLFSGKPREIAMFNSSKQRTLRFQVCNGMANQRLSIVYGILLAHRLGRTPVLPVLLSNGIHNSTSSAPTDDTVPFENVYDQPFFVQGLASFGINILMPNEIPVVLGDHSMINLRSLGHNVTVTLQSAKYSREQHLSVDCPVFKMLPAELSPVRDAPLIWAVLDSLRPAQQTNSYVLAIQYAIRQHGSKDGTPAPFYNFLHLRIENEWIQFCMKWTAISDGVVRDNCYTNTDEVDMQLRLFAFGTDVPLFVAADWTDVEPNRSKQTILSLKKAGYQVVTSRDVFPEEVVGADPHIRSLVEYYLGLGSNRFIGNSVSTYAALAIMERRHRGQWAAYYNGGNVPLAPYLPVLKLAWVFTYNSWSPVYDYMLKAAVQSAAHFGTLEPYCIFDGNTSSQIGHWLVDNNVTLIRHVPAWRAELIKKARSRMKDNVQHSHLFKNPDMLVSTFQRVDLPAVPILDQYTYVLYTDADVYFRRGIHMEDFGLPLPHSVSMSYEMDKIFPYNAGIILANLPTMRLNYKAFLSMMLDNNDGLYYPNYGPADQGILNKFYEHDLRNQMLNQAFNTKPYNDFDNQSFLIHFHGPKPHEYLSYLETGKCDFGTLCEKGVTVAVCPYALEWAVHIPEEAVGVGLSKACSWMTDPTLMQVYKKKAGLATPEEQCVLKA